MFFDFSANRKQIGVFFNLLISVSYSSGFFYWKIKPFIIFGSWNYFVFHILASFIYYNISKILLKSVFVGGFGGRGMGATNLYLGFCFVEIQKEIKIIFLLSLDKSQVSLL